ncbi:class V aminotransferase [Candidatus Desantisbacteria bacterium CG1_02_38_46]|uniref:Aminotransferase n=3 Tax=unclassified Candidatus Desantisiibacteriota TaxID=3106372 RepID=A0A2H9PEL9_9BACT|nr:MAG: class V aminotransferase [Candidatus Desantisbacteria bacterium CG1_02_38_46]PIU52188.1 MAG: aminotransferase [Candidatus Desantisbacteria bacterium CG07_land_8_20_14_0_80_39_15]PIZ17314.1 MAG: aminotransferase [Candidatus Desantisbacteria bacterium CG_4_10_14_0_8_um_filter_39_17]
MKKYLLTPGPTPVPAEAALKESLPIIHHRTAAFGKIFEEVNEGLKYVFQTKNDVLIFASSGTGVMEGSIVNLLSPGDKLIVSDTGKFGERWWKIAKAYGIEYVLLKEEDGYPTDIEKIKKALKDNPQAKAVYTTLTETSTCVVNDIKTIGEVVANTEAVLVVDAISGLGAQEMHSDKWKVDVVVTGSQKGLMIPPGLAFASVSEKAWKLVENAKLPKFYFDWKQARKSIATKETPYTPAISLIVALSESLKIIKDEGMENIWKRHQLLADATRAGVKAMGLQLFSKAPCNAVTAVSVPQGLTGSAIYKKMRDDFGVNIAAGQGGLKDKIFRIAHLGYMEKFDIIIALSALEMTLEQSGYKLELGRAIAEAEKIFLSGCV